jgi:hypothetical protein
MSRPTYSDAEWRKLVKIQAEIAEQRRAALKASQEAMARLARLDQYEALLRDRAGDFIARDYKEIAELEELERREKEELDRLEKERVEADRQKEREAELSAAAEHNNAALLTNGQVLAATSEDPTLTQLIASANPSSPFDWDSFLLAPAGQVVDVGSGVASPSGLRGSFSPSGNTVGPAGGSPSNAQ